MSDKPKTASEIAEAVAAVAAMTPAERVAANKRSDRRRTRPARVNGPVTCHARQIRTSLGLTLDDVCDAIGFSKAGMSQVENGGDCMITTAMKMAAFYGKQVDELWSVMEQSK